MGRNIRLNKLNEQNAVEQFINSAVNQTYYIFKPSISQKKEFSSYFEDMIMFEIISCKSKLISFCSKENEITDNLKASLIASGISQDGELPTGYKYYFSSFFTNASIHSYAKKRAKELERNLLGASYQTRSKELLASSQNKIPNPYEIVELGIARRERESGYIQELEYQNITNIPFEAWNYSADFFKKYNLDSTLAYEICSKINDSPEVYRHFPLATNMALRKMAKIDFFVSIQGLDKYNNKEELLYTLRNIKAAKITDRELIEPFEKRFIEVMSPYMEKEGIKFETEEKNKMQRINPILAKKKRPY